MAKPGNYKNLYKQNMKSLFFWRTPYFFNNGFDIECKNLFYFLEKTTKKVVPTTTPEPTEPAETGTFNFFEKQSFE